MAKTDLFARIASGEVDMGQMPSSIIAEREKSFKVNVETVIPSVGVPLAVEQIALVKGTKKKAEAMKFIDWFGSADVQGAFAKKFNSMPVNKTAAAQANPDVVKFFSTVKQQDIDWGLRPGEHGRLGGEDRARIHAVGAAPCAPSRTAAGQAGFSPDRYP